MEKKQLNMLTVEEYNKRITSRSYNLKPGIACDNCGGEIIIESSTVIKDSVGPRYNIAKCTNHFCKQVYKLFVR